MLDAQGRIDRATLASKAAAKTRTGKAKPFIKDVMDAYCLLRFGQRTTAGLHFLKVDRDGYFRRKPMAGAYYFTPREDYPQSIGWGGQYAERWPKSGGVRVLFLKSRRGPAPYTGDLFGDGQRVLPTPVKRYTDKHGA